MTAMRGASIGRAVSSSPWRKGGVSWRARQSHRKAGRSERGRRAGANLNRGAASSVSSGRCPWAEGRGVDAARNVEARRADPEPLSPRRRVSHRRRPRRVRGRGHFRAVRPDRRALRREGRNPVARRRGRRRARRRRRALEGLRARERRAGAREHAPDEVPPGLGVEVVHVAARAPARRAGAPPARRSASRSTCRASSAATSSRSITSCPTPPGCPTSCPSRRR